MSVQNEPSCPEGVLASIAWYPDQLDEERRGLVESHAAECAACREELAYVQGESEPEIPLPDADEFYQGVLARIERSEGAASTPPAASAPTPAPRRRTFAFGARPALAAGLAVALLGGLIGALGTQLLAGSQQPTYEVAGSPLAAAGPSLDVVFRPDASASEIQAGLAAVGGQLVSGPTSLGVYRVALTPEADLAAAARSLQEEGQGVATFAQPALR